MRNFDAEREMRPRRPVEERTFQLGGEVFVAADRFRPEVLAPLDDIREAKTDPTTCACGHRLHEHQRHVSGRGAGACAQPNCPCDQFAPVVIEPGTPLGGQLAALDSTLLGMIEGGEEGGEARARYLAVRNRVDDPLEIEDITAVVRWLTARDTGRPTGRPADSTAGPLPTGTSSMPSSSSPAIPMAQTG